MLTVATLDSTQLAALRFYAGLHGGRWKAQLAKAWRTGRYDGLRPRDPHAKVLEALRVHPDFGPGGLKAFVPITAVEGPALGVLFDRFEAETISAWDLQRAILARQLDGRWFRRREVLYRVDRRRMLPELSRIDLKEVLAAPGVAEAVEAPAP